MKSMVFVVLAMVLVGLVAFMSLSGECSATDIVVDAGGDGDYLTIQEGIDNSSNSDTVYVWAGTYSENVELNVSVSLIGNGSASTIIDDGDDGAVVNITSSWCNVTGFNITASNNNGINISADNVNVSGNVVVSNNKNGIWCNSDNSSIYSNTIVSNILDGILLSTVVDVDISNNNISSNQGNGITIAPSSERIYCIDNIISTNSLAGVYIGTSCNYCVFSQNTLIHNGNNGIRIHINGHHNVIDNNTLISDSGSYGIECFVFSNHNVIENNTLISENDVGIKLSNSDYNMIQYNNISTNSNQGVWLAGGSDWNTIAFTTFYNNLVGVQIDASSNNSIYNCTFELNDYGINITGNSYVNLVYYNEFIENTVQADDGFATVWDDGIGRGNYWSDYLGVDLDGDGIGDTLLDHLGFDQYPIVHAVSPPEPEGEDEEASVGSTVQTLLIGILPLIVVLLLVKYLRANMEEVTTDKRKSMVAGGRRKRRGKL